jgi:AcrR family transcriptional regulator
LRFFQGAFQAKDPNMSKGELTRQRIVELAAPIFNQRGFAGSSMQDVMEATGLEKGGLYRHFTSKEELAAEAFRYAMSKAMRTRTDGLDSALSPLDKLRALICRFIEQPSALPGGCPLLNTAVDADDGNPMLRKLALDGFCDWRERLAAIVQEGIRKREIRKSVEPRRIANTMIATLEGALLLSRLECAPTALRDAQESLEALLDEIACPAYKAARSRRTFDTH